MKANELMIGDWVNIGGDLPQYSRVTEFKRYDIQVCNYWIDAKCITPIPLTPEILEKNGFKHYATYPDEDIWMNRVVDPEIEVIFTEEKSASIRIFNYSEEDDGKEIINLEDNGKPRYVHELQHALRLCGLNELANNFKV